MDIKISLPSVLALFFCVFFLSSCSQNRKSDVKWISTTPSQPWQVQKNFKTCSTSQNIFTLDTSKTQQTIDGFGACFNELGWTSLSALSRKDRNEILKELFEPGAGANFNICRMPLGANDFSRDWYSYNEQDGDFKMENFSIQNDLETLIPFIKSAQAYNADLKIWASPWSPPAWMKYNDHYACATSGEDLAEKYSNDLPPERQGKEGTNMFIQEPRYFEAYALYFAKFIEAYREQNIDIYMVMPQNEFNSCQIFPSCTWTAEGLAEFIGGYLGPKMNEIGVDVMMGTMERPDASLIDPVLLHPSASQYIKGVGFQWAGKNAVPEVNEKYEDLKLYQTEQECGDGKNDWEHCLHAWDLMKHYLHNGINAYMYWNMSLKKGGYSRWGWQQNSLVTINPEDKTYHFNHEYYLMKHVSRFVKPGAKKIDTDKDVLAFLNPDKSVVAVYYNDDVTEKEYTFKVKQKSVSAKLKPKSFNTLIIK